MDVAEIVARAIVFLSVFLLIVAGSVFAVDQIAKLMDKRQK